MRLSEIRAWCIKKLSDAEIERPRYVSDLILSAVLGIERALLPIKEELEITASQYEKIYGMIEERERRMPLSYILGEAEFYGRVFSVGEGCLIPRPETELLVEKILDITKGASRFADWCTGSGCIGITLLLENEDLCGYGIDSSEAALNWAVLNTKKYGLSDRFMLIKNSDPGNCDIGPGSLDFIAANPPYIPSSQLAGLMSDVKDYEPLDALDGGADGTDLYRLFFSKLPRFLKEGGVLAFETGGDEQARVLIEAAPPELVLLDRIYDYNGLLRHLAWKKRGR